MSMEYIRKYYGVPAKRGMMAVYGASDGEEITFKIVGSDGARLRGRMQRPDGSWSKRTALFHPTWHIAYPNTDSVTDSTDRGTNRETTVDD